MAVDDFKGHPSPVLKTEETAAAEKEWKDIELEEIEAPSPEHS